MWSLVMRKNLEITGCGLFDLPDAIGYLSWLHSIKIPTTLLSQITDQKTEAEKTENALRKKLQDAIWTEV